MRYTTRGGMCVLHGTSFTYFTIRVKQYKKENQDASELAYAEIISYNSKNLEI